MKKMCVLLISALLLSLMGCSTGSGETTSPERIPVVQDPTGERVPIQPSTEATSENNDDPTSAPTTGTGSTTSSQPATENDSTAPSAPNVATMQESTLFTIPKSLSDNCVLQQKTTVNVWGKYSGEGELTLIFNGKEYKTTVKDGEFCFRVDTPAASLTSYDIIIHNGAVKKTIRNVAVGEVFLMGGQSNMAFYNVELTERPPEATDGGNPYIRFTNTVPYGKRMTDPLEVQGTWYVTSNGTFDGMSAFVSWFSRRMYEELQVPIGVVTCAMSDSSLPAWLTEEDAAKMENENVTVSQPYYQHTPGQLYNTILYSYLNYTFRGVVWYQGESSTHETYEKNLTHFINCWRKYLNAPELPFVIVQLPGYATTANWPIARQAQKNVANAMKNVAYSVNIDLGDQSNIHPQDKKPAAQRAADVMLNSVFGKNRPSAAMFGSAAKSGDTVTITLKNADGLKITGDMTGIEITQNGTTWTAVNADQVTISGNTVRISGVSGATALRYAWESWPTVSLFNGNDLPVEAFYAELN